MNDKVTHHDPEAIYKPLHIEPYDLRIWQAQDETVLEYFAGEESIARFNIKLTDDGGVAWTRAWVRDDYQGHGIYTHLHKWALKQPSSTILAEGDQTDMYLRSGYTEVQAGVLKQEEDRSKAWLKGR